MTAELTERKFFARTPVWVRTLPSMGICLLLLMPWAVARLAGINVSGTDFLPAFFNTMATIGTTLVALLVLVVVAATKRPVPILTVDAAGLATPILKLPWASIRKVFVSKYFGLVPVLCISTTDDKSLMAKGGFPMSIRYPLSRRIVGAPITIPAVNEIELGDLAGLIDEYRVVAAKHESLVQNAVESAVAEF